MVNEIPERLFKQKLDEILSEQEIRFAGFVNMQGELVEGQFREDVVPFENDEDQKRVFRELADLILSIKFPHKTNWY